MRGYDRDEYEDLDEYEEDGEDQEEEAVGEEEYEEEEAPQPTQEELEYLELRQRLKESLRKQMKKESGSAHANSQDKQKKAPSDNFGSFFGPSQPVISQRVIQESRLLLQNRQTVNKVYKPSHGNNKSSASTPVGSKPQTNGQPPKVTNGLKTKVQMLKNTRDYSFLLSDDADIPAPAKVPPPRHVSVPNSDARSVHERPKSKESLGSTGRKVPYAREERKPLSTGSQVQSKSVPRKLAGSSKPNLMSGDSRKQPSVNNGSATGRPVGPKGLHLKIPGGSNNGSGPGRPLGPKSLPSKIPAAATGKKDSAPNAKSSVLSAHKPSPSKSQTSISKQPLVQKKRFQESNKGMIMPKQQVPASKPQLKQPPGKMSARASFQEERPKKRPVRQYPDDDDDDGGTAISMIRRMFGYNPNKYRDDDDDSDMEAGFDDILKEERRSAKIAKMEDEEELRKIEEEERKEQLRREAKKRKQSQR